MWPRNSICINTINFPIMLKYFLKIIYYYYFIIKSSSIVVLWAYPVSISKCSKYSQCEIFSWNLTFFPPPHSYTLSILLFRSPFNFSDWDIILNLTFSIINIYYNGLRFLKDILTVNHQVLSEQLVSPKPLRYLMLVPS